MRLLLAMMAAWSFYKLADFRIFNLEIIRYRGAKWLKKDPVTAAWVIAAMPTIIHFVIEHARGFRLAQHRARVQGMGLAARRVMLVRVGGL